MMSYVIIFFFGFVVAFLLITLAENKFDNKLNFFQKLKKKDHTGYLEFPTLGDKEWSKNNESDTDIWVFSKNLKCEANLSLVQYMTIDQVKAYNWIYLIEFHCNNSIFNWQYYNEGDRDEDFVRISNILDKIKEGRKIQ